MFELTNDQRRCFALPPVEPGWTRIEPKPSPYDAHTTVLYLEGNVVRKLIQSGSDLYREYGLQEQLSEDLRHIMPKTAKGKPVLLSAAAISKRTGTGTGMSISFNRHKRSGYSQIDVFSRTTDRAYYSNYYEPFKTTGIEDFEKWVETWCAETTAADLADIAAFAALPRQHQKFREGDVFRFRLNRRLWGYGRLILDYAKMRKNKEPFWDILFGKPMACSVYHIATEDPNVTVAQLRNLPSLPSVHIMDNKLYYGEFEIIGNIPVEENEDYPILYGNSINAHYGGVLLQWGKLYRKIDGDTALWSEYRNNGISFALNCNLDVLQRCIAAGSNAPYWNRDNWDIQRDLRNPALRDTLNRVLAQFGLPGVSTLPPD